MKKNYVLSKESNKLVPDIDITNTYESIGYVYRVTAENYGDDGVHRTEFGTYRSLANAELKCQKTDPDLYEFIDVEAVLVSDWEPQYVQMELDSGEE